MFIIHTTPTNPGDSGGPLLNPAGELVGLVSNGTVGMSQQEVLFIANEVAKAYKNGKELNLQRPPGTPQVRDRAVELSDIREMLGTISAINKKYGAPG